MRYSKNTDGANDIFQQAFYLIYKNIGQLKNEKALSGWIKSIFINTALEYIKKNAKFSTLENLDQHHDATWDWNEAVSNLAVNELTKLIQELPEGCQAIFNLYIIEGFSHKEIATKLNISVGTSKSQLYDARRLLKKKIVTNSIIHAPKY